MGSVHIQRSLLSFRHFSVTPKRTGQVPSVRTGRSTSRCSCGPGLSQSQKGKDGELEPELGATSDQNQSVNGR